jgi:hypothetical protein
MHLVVFGLASGLMAGTTAPAVAQGIEIGSGGVHVETGRDRVSRGEAVGIARREGLRDVDDVSRRGPLWRIEGQDRRGSEMTVAVDARTGEVRRVSRE